MVITVNSLFKLLLEKGVITEDEMNKMSDKLADEMKEKANEAVEKLKKEDKTSFYDELLHSDISGNA